MHTIPSRTTELADLLPRTDARRPRVRGACSLITVLIAGVACTPPRVTQATAALDQTVLATAQRFAVLAGSAVTSTGATVVEGDLGIDPGLAVTGFPPGLVIAGMIHAGDAVARQAKTDLATAYVTLAGEAPTQDLTGQDLGGLTLTPGVYRFSSSAQLTGRLTLDALGDPSAVFVFQIGTTLTTATDASVLVLGGTGDCNVFWQVGSSATLGTRTAFKGNLLALTAITLDTGATVSGRALARNAAVTMDGNAVSRAQCTLAGGSDAGVPGDGGGGRDAAIDAGTPLDGRGGVDGGVDAPADAGAPSDCNGVDAPIDAAVIPDAACTVPIDAAVVPDAACTNP
jgi:Ice-binding-like